MNAWHACVLTGIYTLTPTHCGTGQTTGAIDLPVAREATTGFPILPATSLKGVARDYAAKDSPSDQSGLAQEDLDWLFGKAIEDVTRAEAAAPQDDRSPAQLEAGALVFTEGRLVAFPIRSLNRPFLHVTCPLILERLERDLRVLGFEQFLQREWFRTGTQSTSVQVADRSLVGQPLVLEDLVYEAPEVAEFTGLRRLGDRLVELLPAVEEATRERLVTGLVMIPDADFKDLMQRAIPVQPRIKLTRLKTTGRLQDERGNLWYEEYVPADCLFLAVIGERRQRRSATATTAEPRHPPGEALRKLLGVRERIAHVQIGGNETVGHGLCLWNFWTESEVQPR